VDTNVSEADVGRVKVGQVATFTVDAFPGQVFRGRVSQIREAPINVQNVITYDVVIAVSNPDLKLFPGMTANVKILIDRHNNVLRVPNMALRFRPVEAAPARPAGRRGPAADPPLWVLGTDDKPRAVAVKYGLNDGAYTEIASGDLKEGDRVIAAALSKKGANAPTAAPMPGGGRRGPGF
jgi:HlyD family secretion protein